MSTRMAAFAALFTSIGLTLMFTSSALASWFIEGEELTSTAALTTAAAVDEPFTLKIPSLESLKIECTGSTLDATSPILLAGDVLKGSSFRFLSCNTGTTGCALEEKNETIATLPLTALAIDGSKWPEDRLIFTPQTKKTLAEINFSALNTCALAGLQPLKGTVTFKAPKLQEELAAQPVEGLGSVENNSLEIGSGNKTYVEKGKALLKLVAGKAWGAVPSPPATNCPIKSEGVHFKASVTVGNEASLREEVVNDTRIPVGESGACSEIAKYTTGVSEGKITTAQSEAYKAKIAELVVPGATIYSFKWHENSGSKETFETLGVFDTSGKVKFEPIGSWEDGPTAESTPAVEDPGGTWNWGPLLWTQYTLLGTIGFEAKMTYQIIYNGANEITSKTSLISFFTGFGWNAAATKEEEAVVIDGVNCNKVTVTITYVTGFKSLKLTAGGGGFSGSVEVTGILGANGQHQEADTLCVNGDGKRLIA